MYIFFYNDQWFLLGCLYYVKRHKTVSVLGNMTWKFKLLESFPFMILLLPIFFMSQFGSFEAKYATLKFKVYTQNYYIHIKINGRVLCIYSMISFALQVFHFKTNH